MIAQMSVQIILALEVVVKKKYFFYLLDTLKKIRVLELVDRENLSFSDVKS